MCWVRSRQLPDVLLDRLTERLPHQLPEHLGLLAGPLGLLAEPLGLLAGPMLRAGMQSAPAVLAAREVQASRLVAPGLPAGPRLAGLHARRVAHSPVAEEHRRATAVLGAEALLAAHLRPDPSPARAETERH